MKTIGIFNMALLCMCSRFFHFYKNLLGSYRPLVNPEKSGTQLFIMTLI